MSAYDDLMTALRGLDDRGEQTPCQGPHRDRWISEDAEDREAAARMCEPCPIRAQCLAAAAEVKATHSVWGGRDLTPTNRRQKANPAA